MAHPASKDGDALLEDCRVRRQRRSGPGGQHRNKVETAIVLVHESTGCRAEASERRSQAENLRRALFRLRLELARSVREPWRPGDPVWERHRQGRRMPLSGTHADFPTVLACALDALAHVDGSLPEAAELLGVTSSQLVKVLARDPQALADVNRSRSERGWSVLRP